MIGHMTRTRVMVVDHNPGVGELITELLDPDEFEVETQSDAHTALAKLRSGYDLLILEPDLAGMRGDDLLEQLRKFDRRIGVLLLIAYRGLGVKTDIDALDISAWIQKPFGAKQLRQTVTSILRTRGLLAR